MSLALTAGLVAIAMVQQTPRPDGYLAESKEPSAPAVLVLHPWWGLNADVKAICDQLSAAGFTAFAPDLFEGKTATTEADAEALVKAFMPKRAEVQDRIKKSGDFLASKNGDKRIAVIGYSFGAYHGLWYSNAAPERVRSIVIFYGTGPEDFSKSTATFLGHFAEKDDFEPKESVDGLRKALDDAGRPNVFHTYPGMGHWFVEPSVKDAYKKEAADLAWGRTIKFLRETLGD